MTDENPQGDWLEEAARQPLDQPAESNPRAYLDKIPLKIRDFVISTLKRRDEQPGFAGPKDQYGHAALALAYAAGHDADESESEQLAAFKQGTKELIQKYGKGILPLLRQELKLSLDFFTEDELNQLGLTPEDITPITKDK